MVQAQQQSSAHNALMIQQKFKSKTQLYTYLTQRLQVYLPPKQYCRMEFLTALFEGKKAAVLNDKVPHFTVPSEPQVSVKLIFPALLHDQELMLFFDSERFIESQKLPPKSFFWGIMFTVRRDLTHNLLNEVIEKKLTQSAEKAQALANFQFEESWLEKLLEFPMNSTTMLVQLNSAACSSLSDLLRAIGGGRSGNIFAHLGRARKPAQRKAITLPNTLVEYERGQARIDDRHVTIRKVPNVIKNSDSAEEDLE